MKLYRETTKWDTPNHTYLLNDSKQYMHGYIQLGTAALRMFKAPIRFDTRGRSFQYVSDYSQDDSSQDAAVIEVQGSKGDKYYVRLQDSAAECSCTGFKYRGECKHLEIARKALIYL
jgi:hypothetical protein